MVLSIAFAVLTGSSLEQVAKSGQEAKKPPNVIKLLSKQRVELEAQLTASVVGLSDVVEVTVNIGNIMCRVANSSWDPLFMGHFPSSLQVIVTPQNAEALFSVNKSTSNQAFKINSVEQMAIGLGIGVSSQVSYTSTESSD